MREKIHKEYPCSDMTALFMVHRVLNLIFSEAEDNLRTCYCDINQINNAWRAYKFWTHTQTYEANLEIEFELFRVTQLKSQTQPFRTHWELREEDGLVVKVTIKSKEYQLKFLGNKILTPDIQSQDLLRELQESLK